MAPLIYNGTTLTAVVYNGTNLSSLVYNGTAVWQSGPTIGWFTSIYNTSSSGAMAGNDNIISINSSTQLLSNSIIAIGTAPRYSSKAQSSIYGFGFASPLNTSNVFQTSRRNINFTAVGDTVIASTCRIGSFGASFDSYVLSGYGYYNISGTINYYNTKLKIDNNGAQLGNVISNGTLMYAYYPASATIQKNVTICATSIISAGTYYKTSTSMDPDGVELSYKQTLLGYSRYRTGMGSVDSVAIVGYGLTSGWNNYHNAIERIDSNNNLVGSAVSLGQARYELGTASFSDGVVFWGGYGSSSTGKLPVPVTNYNLINKINSSAQFVISEYSLSGTLGGQYSYSYSV